MNYKGVRGITREGQEITRECGALQGRPGPGITREGGESQGKARELQGRAKWIGWTGLPNARVSRSPLSSAPSLLIPPALVPPHWIYHRLTLDFQIIKEALLII